MMKKFFYALLMMCFTLPQGEMLASDELIEKKKLTLFGNIVVGGTVGAAEVAMPGQILTYAMNAAIKGTPFRLQDSYKGGLLNAVGQVPITAMQKLTQAMGLRYAEQYNNGEPTDLQKLAVSSAAGVADAVIDTPSNAIQLYLQDARNKGKGMLKTASELGMKSFRGFTSNALMKEVPFVVGYQIFAPKGKQIAQGYVDNESVATALGGAAAGVATAVATQPGAVVRNLMQEDRLARTYKTTWQTISTVCKQRGVAGLWDGMKARGTRVAIAVPLYAAYTNMLEDYITKRNTRS